MRATAVKVTVGENAPVVLKGNQMENLPREPGCMMSVRFKDPITISGTEPIYICYRLEEDEDGWSECDRSG